MLIGEQLTESIIGAAIEVHRELGPGLLESAYEQCMVRELERRGLQTVRQVELPITYKGEASTAATRSTCSSRAKLSSNSRQSKKSSPSIRPSS